MRVIRWYGEPLGELVDRAYSFKKRSDAKAAEQAIVEANPGLDLTSGSTAATPGAVVSVPDVEGATPRESAEPLAASATAAVLQQLVATVPLLKQQIETTHSQATTRLEKSLAALDHAAVKRAAAKDSQLKKAVADRKALLTARKQQLKQVATVHASGLTSAQTAAQKLLQLLTAD